MYLFNTLNCHLVKTHHFLYLRFVDMIAEYDNIVRFFITMLNDVEDLLMCVTFSAYLNAMKPIAGIVLSYACFTGCLGFTFQLAFIQDLLSMMTLHIYCFYVYAARFSVQCCLYLFSMKNSKGMISLLCKILV